MWWLPSFPRVYINSIGKQGNKQLAYCKPNVYFPDKKRVMKSDTHL